MGRQSNYRQQNQTAQPKVDYEAIIEKGDVDKLVASAKEVASAIQHVKNSQIRGIFSTVRQIQLSWVKDPNGAYRQAILLKPRIAYAESRNNIGYLNDVVQDSIDRVAKAADEKTRRIRFAQFVDFFEAIVGYHKALGGKN